MTSPTQRSIKLMKDAGFYVEIVEHWNAFTRTRNDLFGFADLIALRVGEPVTFLQVTSWSNVPARITKITEEKRARLALECGTRILVHGWGYVTDHDAWGTPTKSWQVRAHVVSLGDGGEYLVDDMERPTV